MLRHHDKQSPLHTPVANVNKVKYHKGFDV